MSRLIVSRLSVSLVVVWGGAAWAGELPRVLVFESSSPTPLARELEVRLMGELSAAGFEVVPLPRSGVEAQKEVVSGGGEYRPVAAFAIVEEPHPAAETGSRLRLWLADRNNGALEQLEREPALPGSRAASSLAVQGVEWLRAKLRELHPAVQIAPPEAAPLPRPAPAASPAPRAPRLVPALDLGVLFDSATGAAALTPLLRLSYVRDASSSGVLGVGARLSVAGLGTPSVLETSVRQIEVEQSFVLLEAITALELGSWLCPIAALGVGAYRVSVQGVAPAPLVGRSEATFSPLGGLGAGMLLRPIGDWVGKLEVQSLFALQPTAVEIDTTRIATFGRPLFVFSAGVGVAL